MVYKNKDVELQIKPLENGKAEYEISLHDFGNLESIVDKTVSYDELNYILKELDKDQYMIGELRYM